MKQFNLEEYLRLKEEGKEPKIVTKSGWNVRIVCTETIDFDSPIVALVKPPGKEEIVLQYTTNGAFLKHGSESGYDLLFADPEPKYRPFKDADEFMEAQKEKGLYLYFKHQYCFKIATGINRGSIAILWDSHKVEEISFEDLFAKAIWTDGSPCGVKEG